jgi:hypothetical protein
MIIETNQIRNMDKYKTGTPQITSSTLNINTMGMFKNKNRAIDITINFCSCLFFILISLDWLKIIKKTALMGSAVFLNWVYKC